MNILLGKNFCLGGKVPVSMQNDLNEKRFCQPFASVDTKTGSRNAFHMPLHIKLATGEGPSMVHRVGKRIVITEL